MAKYKEVKATLSRTYRAWLIHDDDSSEDLDEALRTNLHLLYDPQHKVLNGWEFETSNVDICTDRSVSYEEIPDISVIVDTELNVVGIKDKPISFFLALENLDNFGGFACSENKIIFKLDDDTTMISYIGPYFSPHGYDECTISTSDMKKPWFYFKTEETARKWFTHRR